MASQELQSRITEWAKNRRRNLLDSHSDLILVLLDEINNLQEQIDELKDYLNNINTIADIKNNIPAKPNKSKFDVNLARDVGG